MPVKITCRKLELAPELHELFQKKAEKLKKYFDRVDKIDVVLTAQKYRRICEITFHAGHFDCVAKAEAENEGGAFDEALRSVIRQIKERKNKAIDRNQKAINPAKATNHSGKEVPLPTNIESL